MKYKIEDKIEKEWQGKQFVQATLINENGEEFQGVSAWSGEFAGEFFEGEIEKNPKGFWRIKSPPKGNPNFRTQQMEKVMSRKEESIGKTMDRKEESIALAAAQRDAVLIVTTLIDSDRFEGTVIDLKDEIVKWRNWFLSDDFRNPPPF